MFSQYILNRSSVKVIALFAAALIVCLGLMATIVAPQADAAGCKSRIAAGGQIKGKSGKWYMQVKAKGCGGLAENTVSFCNLDSRSNPRVHGTCYGSGSVIYKKSDTYVLKSKSSGGRKPSSLKMVVITDDGRDILYKIVNFR